MRWLGVLLFGCVAYPQLATSETLVREEVIAAIDSYMEVYGAAVEEPRAEEGAITCNLPSKVKPKAPPVVDAEENAFQTARDAARKQQQDMDFIFRQTQLAQDTQALSQYIVALNPEDFNETVAHLLAIYALNPQDGYYKPKAIAALLRQLSVDLRKAKIIDDRNRSLITQSYRGAMFMMTTLALAGSLTKFGQSNAFKSFMQLRRAEGLAGALKRVPGALVRRSKDSFKDALHQFRSGVGAFAPTEVGGLRHAVNFSWLGTKFLGERFFGAAKGFGSSMKQMVKSMGNGVKNLGTKRFWTHTVLMRNATPEFQRNMLIVAVGTPAYAAIPEDWDYLEKYLYGEAQRDKLDPLDTLSLLNAKGAFDLGEELVTDLVEPVFADIPALDAAGDYSREVLKLFADNGLDVQLKMEDYCMMIKLYSMANNEQKALSPEYMESVHLPSFHKEYESVFGYSEKPEYQKLITDTETAPEVSLHAIDRVLVMLKQRIERADAKIVELKEAKERKEKNEKK